MTEQECPNYRKYKQLKKKQKTCVPKITCYNSIVISILSRCLAQPDPNALLLSSIFSATWQQLSTNSEPDSDQFFRALWGFLISSL